MDFGFHHQFFSSGSGFHGVLFLAFVFPPLNNNFYIWSVIKQQLGLINL